MKRETDFQRGYRQGLAANPMPPDGLYRIVGGKVERVEADEETVSHVAEAIHDGSDPWTPWDALPASDTSYGTGKQRRRLQARAVLKALGAS